MDEHRDPTVRKKPPASAKSLAADRKTEPRMLSDAYSYQLCEKAAAGISHICCNGP